jgi:hypothetical protein
MVEKAGPEHRHKKTFQKRQSILIFTLKLKYGSTVFNLTFTKMKEQLKGKFQNSMFETH